MRTLDPLNASPEPFGLDRTEPDARWHCPDCDRVEGECPGHDDPVDLVEYSAVLVKEIAAMRGYFAVPPSLIRTANRVEDIIRLRYPEVMP